MSLSIGKTLVKAKEANQILNRINQYLKQDFQGVEAEFAAVMQSDTNLTRKVGDFLKEAKSKRLRAAMVLLASKSCGYQGEANIKIATAIELIHLATLLHDDVIDEALTRRNRPSVNAKWDKRVAILMADYLYCHGFKLSVECLDQLGLDLIAGSTAFMCEGEMFQIQKENDIFSIEDYFRVIKGKTANLFATSMKLGGMLAGIDPEQVEKLGKYGMSFGMAFQITDDTLDYTASDRMWGKDIGTDIACGKQTLPLIRTIEVADEEDRNFLTDSLMRYNHEGDEIDFNRVIKIVKNYDGIHYSQQKAAEFAQTAISAVENLPENESRELLLDMARYVSNRSY